MRTPMWHHRNLELLQNRMTIYLSGRALTPSRFRSDTEKQTFIRATDQERCDIQLAWEKIKREVDESLAEMDQASWPHMK